MYRMMSIVAKNECGSNCEDVAGYSGNHGSKCNVVDHCGEEVTDDVHGDG